MNFEEWQMTILDVVKNDALWKMSVYKYALFVGELGWFDTTKTHQDYRLREASDQLYGALGSISANIAEGYSRGSAKDRARFYEYSLGSARESRDWYYKCRHVLGDKVYEHRVTFLTHVIRLLLTMIPQQRGKNLHEEAGVYKINEEITLDDLLNNVPMP